eukprot:TRINITY_DN12293_c1_g2_i2.p2 TRINITY_DN12293_c1_g2~~TRINITY_DN12293_c1_g2_i2.p2  ORF type:complete len:112 (+),score=12.21 TRINITY_DN12293_c1_g2_i2:494-829(+)
MVATVVLVRKVGRIQQCIATERACALLCPKSRARSITQSSLLQRQSMHNPLPELCSHLALVVERMLIVPISGTFQERKLVSGGKQGGAVNQAQDAARTASQKASEAMGLQG